MLERLDLITGIIGGAIGLISVLWAWRKGLLQSSFDRFRERYMTDMEVWRNEIDEFKTDVRGYINKNDERHTAALERIVELYQQTKDQVAAQTSICKVIQAKREGNTKADDMWRQRIEEELTEVQNDVRHIKKVINHVN